MSMLDLLSELEFQHLPLTKDETDQIIAAGEAFKKGHYENSIFMQNLCDFMTREISYLNDETEVLKIAARYMHNFHKYDIEKYVARKKRSSTRKVIAAVLF